MTIAPMLVFSSTCGFAASAPADASRARAQAMSLFMGLASVAVIFRGPAESRRLAGSSRAFVEDARAAVFPYPVLALAHLAREVAARVVLVEAHHGEIVPPGVEEDAGAVELDLDPGLARVYLVLLLRKLRVADLP